VEAVLIGAGLRGGEVYGRWALSHPERLRVVALAEPDAGRREAAARAHGLPADAVFPDWKPLLDGPRRAPVAIVATGDTEHVGPALRALEAERFAVRGSMVGHYGGDDGLVEHFVSVIERGDAAAVRASGRSALEGHLLGFAAEEARLVGEVVELAEWRESWSEPA